MEVAGTKFGGWQDAVTVCPREVQLDAVVESFRAALEADDPKAMQAALEAIRGDNYSHYVPASQKELADGAKPLLESLLRRLPSNHAITMEQTAFQALLDIHGDWLETVIDFDTKIEAVPGDNKSLLLYRGREHGHRIKVVASQFRGYAEDTSTKQRFKSVKANMIDTDLMHQSGNYADPSHVEKRRAISQTFLMDLDFDGEADELDYDLNDDDSSGDTECRGARQRAFPKGYFMGRKRNILPVSKFLGIGYLESLYLRFKLGKADFFKLVQAHGGAPGQSSIPMESDFTCEGVPAAPGYKKESCSETQSNPSLCCVGGNTGGEHVFYGWFACQRCHRKMAPRERAELEHRLEHGQQLSETQLNRLQVLRKRVFDHRDRDVKYKKQRREDLGDEKYRANRRAIDRRQAAKTNADASKREEKATKAAKAYAKSDIKKKSGSQRASNANMDYPKPFMKLLARAAALVASESGTPTVNMNLIYPVFDKLMVKEKEGMLNDWAFIVGDDGLPYPYLFRCSRERAQQSLAGAQLQFGQDDPTRENGRSECNEGVAGRPAFHQHIVDLLYKDKPESENHETLELGAVGPVGKENELNVTDRKNSST